MSMGLNFSVRKYGWRLGLQAITIFLISVFFIGNKFDLDMDRIISKEQGEDLAAELGGGRIVHYETSARNNLGVTEVCYQ